CLHKQHQIIKAYESRWLLRQRKRKLKPLLISPDLTTSIFVRPTNLLSQLAILISETSFRYRILSKELVY
ncbi:hypothetical protein KSS87_014377, partial [Heliosperma pusillum]